MKKVKQVNVRFYLDNPLDQMVVNKLSSPYIDQTRLIKKLLAEHFGLQTSSNSIELDKVKENARQTVKPRELQNNKADKRLSTKRQRLNGGFKGFEATIE